MPAGTLITGQDVIVCPLYVRCIAEFTSDAGQTRRSLPNSLRQLIIRILPVRDCPIFERFNDSPIRRCLGQRCAALRIREDLWQRPDELYVSRATAARRIDTHTEDVVSLPLPS